MNSNKIFLSHGGELMLFESKDSFMTTVKKLREKNKVEDTTDRYSIPIYPCPLCGGNMRMDMWGGRVLTSLPPIQQNLYVCDECGFEEYM